MKEIILCKYGEISLKGANRAYFEKLLRDMLKRRTAPFGSFKIYSLQSTVYIEPLDENADVMNFVNELYDNGNTNWNICVTADEKLSGAFGTTVFFLMCPISVAE